jgi:hypothetical protein
MIDRLARWLAGAAQEGFYMVSLLHLVPRRRRSTSWPTA